MSVCFYGYVHNILLQFNLPNKKKIIIRNLMRNVNEFQGWKGWRYGNFWEKNWNLFWNEGVLNTL